MNQSATYAGYSQELFRPLTAWGNVPVTEVQWYSVLEDADLHGAWNDLTQSLTAAANGQADARHAAALVDAWRDRCESLLWFRPPPRLSAEFSNATRVATAGLAAARAAICHLMENRDAGWGPDPIEAVNSALHELSWEENADLRADHPQTTMARAFGIPLNSDAHVDLNDALSEQFRQRKVQTEECARSLCDHLLPSAHDYVPDPRHVLVSLMMAPRPLIAHRTALLTRDLVLCLLPLHAKLAAEAYAPLMRRANQNRFAHAGVRQGLRALSAGDRDPDSRLYFAAYGYLDLIEVPLRLTAEALLRMQGRSGLERLSLARVAQAVASHGGALTDQLGGLLRTRWRNAIAHRDLYWDPVAEIVVFDREQVPFTEFSRTYGRAFSFHQGFEVGVALARSASADLRDAMAVAAGPRPSALRDSRIRDRLSLHGNTFGLAQRRGSSFLLSTGALSPQTFGNLCVALLEAAGEDESIGFWVVYARGYEQPLHITSASISAMGQASTGDAGAQSVVLPYALTPVLASIWLGLGHEAEDVTYAVARFAFTQAHGEIRRASEAVRAGDSAATQELQANLACLRRGLSACTRSLPASQHRLASLASLLSAVEAALQKMGQYSAAGVDLLTRSAAALADALDGLPDSVCQPWPGVTLLTDPHEDLQ